MTTPNNRDAASESDRPFPWDRDRDLAASLLADDELTDVEIAGLVGVSDRTLRRWKEHREFRDRVATLASDLAGAGPSKAITKRNRRLKVLDDCWRRLQRIVEERAADPSMKAVPGGSTGLLVRRIKGVGTGDHFQVVEEYELDGVLLKELREHAKQAAIETGQWTEKLAPVTPDGRESYQGTLTDEQLASAILGLLRKVGPALENLTEGRSQL